jgi:hypothetical protein
MPTTTIETPLRDVRFERRVAKQLCFWWRRHGTDPSHVMTRFLPATGDLVYSGPFPLSAGNGGQHVPFALVGCVMSQERDAGFRREYARFLRGALAPEIPPDRVFVSIQPTDPADHFTPASTWPDEEHPS